MYAELYRPPDWFLERLEREHDGQMRIRWSRARGEWLIEEKIGRAALPPRREDPLDDDFIRARDGYGYLMSVRPGTRMACPLCGLDMSVAVRRSAECVCEHCRRKGRRSRWVAGFWPLDESLLEHLRKLTRTDTLERIKAEEARWALEEKWADDVQQRELRSALFDAAIESLPTFRFAGQTAAWVRDE